MGEVVCVLGMHRSGTSALTRCINLLGLYIGDENSLYAPREDNPLGFWENSEAVKLNDSVFYEFLGQWDKFMPIPFSCDNTKNFSNYHKNIREILERRFRNSKSWLIKDPRVSITLPLWNDVFHELNLNPTYVISIRNPMDVYHSLNKRDKFTKQKAFYLWTIYNLSIIYWTQNQKRLITSYDNLLEDKEKTIQKIVSFLGISTYDYSGIDSFLSTDLRHSKTKLEDLNDLNDITKSLYFLLLESEKDISVLDKRENREFIDYYFSQFLNSPIYIWGASKGGFIVYNKMREKGIRISGFLDKDPSKWNESLFGLPVLGPDEIINIKDEFEKPYIIIGSSYKEEILDELKRSGYCDFKIFENIL